MARKLSSGYVYKNQRLGKWRLAISWQDDDGRQHKMTRSTQVPCYEDKVDRNGVFVNVVIAGISASDFRS